MLGLDERTQSANEQLALALEQTLKSIADFPVDLYNSLSVVKREDVINNFLAELTPAEIEAIKQQTKITYEKNQVAMGNRPKAENFDSYLTSNDYGKELSGKLTLVGTDAKGNPIYQAADSGYGNYIWGDSFVTDLPTF